MKIRSHLVLMVCVVLLPVLLFSAVLTAMFWQQQRNAFDQRFLEGARVMSIALDTEIEASIRVLQALALAPDLGPDAAANFAQRAQRVMRAQPSWSMIGLADAGGQRLLAIGREAETQLGFLDTETAARVLRGAQPVISGVVVALDGHHYGTAIAVPVLRDGAVAYILYAGVEQSAWLRFLGRYPIPADATVTLFDQQLLIIARTLNNERWKGLPGSDDIRRKISVMNEGAYRSFGLEGQWFYTAHRRSVTWGWTIAIGVPAEGVEQTMRESMLMVVIGLVLTGALAVLLTVIFGRRIAKPIAALASSAKALVDGTAAGAQKFERIAEVANVARAFADAGTLLREREHELAAVLTREQQARAEAEAANRAKDEFLAMLSHELRNPLNAIASALAVLERVDAGSEPAVRSRQIIARQTGHLGALVDDLLDVARIASGKIVLDRQPLDLGELVRHTVSVLGEAGRLDQHRVDVDCEPAWVAADRTRSEQIIANLLDNAIKYTPPGGHIGVRVRVDGSEAVLDVRDSGMGIAPELLPHVFELFTQGERTLERSQGGLGLGLTLVQRLVGLQRGRVSAASDGIGRGATFSVRLPRIDAPAQAGPAPRQLRGERRPLRILIVEDNPDGRESLKLLLRLYGHTVHTAEDGPGGVEQALALRPDIAIVDIGLPGCDGYEVARRIRAAEDAPPLRLVALTGYGQDSDREQARLAGFDDYLVKPVEPKALARVLMSNC